VAPEFRPAFTPRGESWQTCALGDRGGKRPLIAEIGNQTPGIGVARDDLLWSGRWNNLARASLAAALHAVDANGAVVVFGNSSGETTSIGFADFRGGQNARLQSFFSFTSGPEEQFAPDLALLVSLVADKSLTPQTGPERNWRDIARVADELRDRRVGGKAVFRVEP